jgi:acetylornithine deacetylase/succinyl-diaminopimelate desuccinylase-like protein
MENFLNDLAAYAEKIKSIKEIILTNIVLLGQTPCEADRNPHTGKSPRSGVFLERLSDGFADECTLDTFGNPYGIVKGSNSVTPPIVLVAHMDTTFDGKSELLYSVTGDAVVGPGLLDNSLGVGVLMSIPQVLKTLGLSFQSDIVLIGLPESLHRCNLKSIQDVFGAWKAPIRAAICVEGGERGRLNYFSNSMVRVEVTVDIPKEIGWEYNNGVNAIIVMNEVINRILEIRLPQRPRTHIVVGCINSGTRCGKAPLYARLGFEVHSDSDRMVEEVFDKVDDICGNISHHTGVKIDLDRISAIKAAKLTSHHPLVQSAVRVMETLDIKPSFESSQSELSVFLSHNIPAITLGVAHGENYHKEDERADIESIFKGIAQIIGVMAAVDQGVCDAR